MKKIILSIDGMTCSACSSGLQKYLEKQDGIIEVSVNLVMASASIVYEDAKLKKEDLDKFIEDAGFKSLGELKEIKQDKIKKKEKILFILYTFLAIFLLYISMGHMIHLPTIFFLDPMEHPWNYMMSLLILTLFFLWYGKDILKNGYKNLIHKTPNMDTLVSIGVFTSFFYSLYQMYLFWVGTINEPMNLYFESSAIVIYFMKLGRYIDFVSKNKTKSAIQKLVQITPTHATVKKDGTLKMVTIDEIKVGDIVVSKPGERISVDGVILKGESHIDESFLTGESMPVFKKKEDSVIAGSMNYDGYLEYKALRIGKNSTISEIVKLVVESANTKPKISSFADRVSGLFVPIVFLISCFTFLGSLLMGFSFSESFMSFVTVLVIACPCSLGLAAPLSIIVSEGLCASMGILVKTSETFESASAVDTIVFDKTGTLTYGKLKIAGMKNFSSLSKREILQIVGSIESLSTHPIASSFTEELKNMNQEFLEVKSFKNMEGLGISGKIKEETYYLGNQKMLQKLKIKNGYEKEEQEFAKKGHSIVYLANDSKILALFGVNDILRKESIKVIQKLKEWNIKTILLTGDHEDAAKRMNESLQMDEVIANVLPKEKSKIIQNLKKEKHTVMMCGDGINDSIALTSSDVGLSMESATDIAMDSASVILTNNDLTSILKFITISKRTMKNIKQNLFWAFLYNVIMIPIAMGLLKPYGISVNPMLASLAMVLSSLTVVLNTLRLRKIKL